MLVWSALVGGAHAEGCLAAVRPGAPAASAAACFAPDASWLDAAGPARGTAAVREGFERLAAGLDPSSRPEWVRLSTETWLMTGLRGGGGWVHVAFDLSGGAGFWSAARVYRGARPWPGPGGPAGEPGWDSAAFVAVFNDVFGRGRADELASHWAPDAVFVSGIGPFQGAEVGEFFRSQARRYEAPRFDAVRHHGLSPDGAWTLEGALTGRCRATGEGFRMPFLMHLRFDGRRIARLYEAFSELRDGCGPFWAAPR